MIALAGLRLLPLPWLAEISVSGIVLHHLADPVRASSLGAAAWVWNLLHQLGAFPFGPWQVLAAYPLVPWVFVMAAGYCLGAWFRWPPERRQRPFFWLGIGLTLAFLVIRGLNRYSDPVPWSGTLLSFLRCNKYPPSLSFLLMTLGPALVTLSWLDRKRFAAANPLLVFGRVPLFYFLVHLFVIHGLTVPLAWLRYGEVRFLLEPLPSMGGKGYPPSFWVWAMGGVPVVGGGGGDAVSAVPLVRQSEGAAYRRVAAALS